MSVNIYNRIRRSLVENINLIYYSIINNYYTFYVLGTSGFTYCVIIDQKYQDCNCEDYENSGICKHICFILFKVLKVFRFNKKSLEIKLPYQNSLQNTSFFDTLIFSDYDWMVFRNKYKNIKLFLKSSFFNSNDYSKFLFIFNRYKIFIENNIVKSDERCVICLENKVIISFENAQYVIILIILIVL